MPRPRPAFDLGLWAACTAVSTVVCFIPAAIDLHLRRASFGKCIPDVLGGLLAGLVLYFVLAWRGWRVSRRRPEQAEDYGDDHRT
jgi:hypothetical protein